MAKKDKSSHGSNRAKERSERRQAKQQKHDAMALQGRQAQQFASFWQPASGRAR